MTLRQFMPRKFSTRLMAMTLVSGLIPILIFSLLMSLAAYSLPLETNLVIRQILEDQWGRSERLLRLAMEASVHQKAKDVAQQLDLYLQAHPRMTLPELQVDPAFRSLAVQAVGTGYTALYDSNTGINRFHMDPAVENQGLRIISEESPDLRTLLEASLGGEFAQGYYRWKEPDGKMHQKFISIVPLGQMSADGVRFSVAAVTHTDEFFTPLGLARDESLETTRRLTQSMDGLIRSFRYLGYLFMGMGIVLAMAIAYWAGTYFSRSVNQLRDATKKVNLGFFDVKIKPAMSGDMGELTEDFNHMVFQLAATTVKKAELEASEARLKAANEQLRQEIQERRRVEEELRESEERFRTIVENTHDGIVIVDDAYRFVYANSVMCQMVGYPFEEIVGRDFRELVDGESVPFIAERYAKRQRGEEVPNRYEVDVTRKDGERRSVEIVSSVIEDSAGRPRTLSQIADITGQKHAADEKQKMEARLQRAQKMEAIGTLAGGVAHDLNNILAGLVSYPELLLMELPQESPLRKPILTIQKAGERAAAIVQDLLTLARRGVAVTEVVNLNEIISAYLKSPEHENLAKNYPRILVKTRLEGNLLHVMGSPIHLAKTLMNLVTNAAEAMPEGGEVFVTTQNQYVDSPIKGYDHVKEGDYVILSVSDTGIGISREDMERIFEPFYTKKVMGRSGTGLGLAVVWGTVKDHEGYIDVESQVGKGATFTVYLPVTRREKDVGRRQIPIENLRGAGESILVVDDVEEQRRIARGILTLLGYAVVTVSSGEEAVEYMRTHSADLLLLDMIMDPGMDGLETYRRILEIHPGQKAVIVSGFSETGRVREAQRLGAGDYVRKPFLLERIGAAVRGELDR
jgi:PAS domain S-box-containing protein